MYSAVSIAFACLLNGAPQAADIAWTPPAATTGQASDVLTMGSLLEASSNNPTSPTVNGVTFTNQGAGINYTGFIGLSFTSYAHTPAWGSPIPGMVALVGGGAYAASPAAIRLQNLTSGHLYLVQIFQPAWDYNWLTRFSGGANTSQYVSSANTLAGGTGPASQIPQYIVGTFWADGTTQAIKVSGAKHAPPYDVVAAVQVRDLSKCECK
jgi:hypothetical protein